MNDEIHKQLAQFDATAVTLAVTINNLDNLNELTLSRLHRNSDYAQRRIYLAIQQGIANYHGNDQFGRIRKQILSDKLESERHNLAEVYKIVENFLRTGRYRANSFGFFETCKAYIFHSTRLKNCIAQEIRALYLPQGHDPILNSIIQSSKQLSSDATERPHHESTEPEAYNRSFEANCITAATQQVFY